MRVPSAVTALLGAVLLAGCAGVPWSGPQPSPLPSASTPPTQAPDPELAGFYQQTVDWRPCREKGMECAGVEVPLDYADPTSGSITLSVVRVPAGDSDGKLGALVVNPGGPGASGIEYAVRHETYFGEPLHSAYDIVGFDPRGVGESTPVDCLTDAELDAFVAADPDPDGPAEVQLAVRQLRDFGRGCLELSGQLAAHVSTEEAARDLDIVRAVLGQPRLAYFGASYGTYLGATYADLFPDRVGRMVLDGAVDPSLGAVETGLIQAEGFEVALRAYVEECVNRDGCYLGSSVEEGTARVAAFLRALDEEPIPTGTSRELTQGLAAYGIWGPLYDRRSWEGLDTALARGLAGDGAVLLSFADAYLGRGPQGYLDNSYEALYAVNCLDPHEEITVAEARTLEDEFLAASPTFGRMFAFSLASCTPWPVDAPATQPVLDAAGAPPILVVGTTRDPATPLAWAEALADELSSGVLVRRDGDGHTGYRSGNSCVDDAVEGYLVAGEVPEGPLDC